jgi:hypothetical protein
MKGRFGAVLAASVTAAIVNFVGVLYFFQPIAGADSPGEPLLPAAVSFLVYVVLSVLLLDWVNQKVGDPMRAGLVIALSQIILVSVDFVLRGDRGLATGGASAVLILITWLGMGAAYGLVLRKTNPAQSQAAHDR